jgi:fibronectin type 3 domain-containing protein
LAASTTYYYKVRASNEAGNSAYSNVASAKTEAPKRVLPGVPANLSATAVSTDRINLSWNAVKDATGYAIERAASANGAFEKIGSANAGETTFSNMGLTASTAYFYRVCAVNEAGSSAYSNVASATTQKSPPAAPAKLIASAVSASQINLSWNAAKDATGYTIERAESANGEFKKIGSANVKETKFSNMGLAASTTYFYRVCAFNEAGSSEFSNVANATTQSSSQSSPSGLTATAVSTTQIDLSWAPAANVIGYTIERSTSENGTFSKTAFVAANVTTYSNMGLAPSTTYYYRVYANCINCITGNSDYSNVASATTQTPPPPPKLPAPNDLASTAVHANRVELTWVNNSTNEFGFYLQRSETPDFGNLTTFTIGAGRTSYSDAGLAEGTDYFYRVCAYGITGNSDCSDVLAVTTRLKPPTNLRAAADSPTSVTLTWADNSDKEKSYWVERLGSDGEWITVGAELPANTQTYQDVSCEPARTYVYRVTALGASAETSSEATASTPTVDPIDLRWLGPVATDHLATVNSSYAVAATDDYLYAVSAGVLNIYSFVTYDAAPEFHSYIRINGAYGVTAAVINGEEFAFVTESKALRVIKPTDPSFSRVVNLPATAFKPVCDGNVVYVACGSAGVAVVDVSDPYNPYLLNTPDMGITQAWSVDARGSALVVANGSNGLVVLDASDPADLVKVGTVDLMGCFREMADNAFDVAIGNNMVWVACVYSGLCQVDISSLQEPVWVRSIPTTAPATGVCTEGDYVFVACNDGISARTGLDAFGCGGGVVEHLGFLRTPGYATRQIATRNRMIFLSDNWYLADVAAF